MFCQLVFENCYRLPQDIDAPPLLNSTNTTTSTSDPLGFFTAFFAFANDPSVVNATTTLAFVLRDFVQEQRQANAISKSLKLSQYTRSNLSDFTNGIQTFFNNQSSTLIFVNTLLDSNPNYNFLYSNYSQTISESNQMLEITLQNQEVINTFFRPLNVQVSQTTARQLIDLLYGPDLNVNYTFIRFFSEISLGDKRGVILMC
jgi:hypothetical protein